MGMSWILLDIIEAKGREVAQAIAKLRSIKGKGGQVVANLGRLEKVELREAWNSEPGDFTPWLAQKENLELLGKTLGMQLELVQQEKGVGPFRADILCKDAREDAWVVIENQLEQTDHTHLGQILTYAAGLDAATMIWISPAFTEEHRAALDWLNEHTDEKTSFLGLEVELWRIGNSPPAPKFNIVAKPNDWSRETRATAERGELTAYKRTQLEYWTAYRKYMTDSRAPCGPAKPDYFIEHPLGSKALHLFSVAARFGHRSSGKAPQLRAEFGVMMDDPGPAFDWFERNKSKIEAALGEPLVWDRESYTGGYYRAFVAKDGDMRDQGAWPEQFAWLRANAEKMYDVFLPLVKEYEKEHA